MFAQLGEYIFEGVKTPATMNDSSSVKVGRITLINGKDAVQFNGEELDEMQLTVQYVAPYSTPATEIEALKASMRAAEVLPFFLGDGTVVGKYIITSVEVSRKETAADGQILSADVSIDLLEYPGGEALEPRGLAVMPPPGVEAAMPAAEPPIEPPASPANSIAEDVSKAKTLVDKMKNTAGDVKKGVSSYKAGVKEVRQLADRAQNLYSSAKNKVEATKKIIKRAADLPTSLGEALKYAENLAKIDYSLDFSVIENDINQLSDSAGKVNDRMGPVISFSATREGGE